MRNLFNKIYKSLFASSETEPQVKPAKKDDYFDIGEWSKPDSLPIDFDDKKEVMLVRFKKNFSQVYAIQYNAKEQIFRNHFDELIDINRIALFLVLSLDDKRWSDSKPKHNYLTDSLEDNDFVVQLGNDQIYHAHFLMTGNRYGYTLCFRSSEKRIYSTKRWLKTPPAFDTDPS